MEFSFLFYLRARWYLSLSASVSLSCSECMLGKEVVLFGPEWCPLAFPYCLLIEQWPVPLGRVPLPGVLWIEQRSASTDYSKWSQTHPRFSQPSKNEQELPIKVQMLSRCRPVIRMLSPYSDAKLGLGQGLAFCDLPLLFKCDSDRGRQFFVTDDIFWLSFPHF